MNGNDSKACDGMERTAKGRGAASLAGAGAMDHVEITSSFTGDTFACELDLGDGEPEEKLERVFRLFNRVSEEDARRLERIGYRLPSLSVGDRVVLNGEAWVCAPVGFEREGG